MIVVLYTILHFLVDGICSLIIYNHNYNSFVLAFCVYNFLAFVLQPFIGLIIDRKKKHKIFLTISIIFIYLGLIINNDSYITLVFSGIGNAFFHIAGGFEVARSSDNDIRFLGIFVSTGIIGLTIGRVYNNRLLLIIFSILLVIVYLLVLIENKEYKNFINRNKIDNNILKENTVNEDKNINIINNEKNLKLINEENFIFNDNVLNTKKYLVQNYFNAKIEVLIILGILIVVFIRSYLGVLLKFDTSSKFILVLISIFIALSKAFGGFIYKWIGCKKAMFISFIITIVCLFYIDSLFAYLLLLLLFNITMPITLYYINIVFNNQYGFSFGLLASVLVPGYMMGFLLGDSINYKILFIVLNAISTFLVIIINRLIKNKYV